MGVGADRQPSCLRNRHVVSGPDARWHVNLTLSEVIGDVDSASFASQLLSMLDADLNGSDCNPNGTETVSLPGTSPPVAATVSGGQARSGSARGETLLLRRVRTALLDLDKLRRRQLHRSQSRAGPPGAAGRAWNGSSSQHCISSNSQLRAAETIPERRVGCHPSALRGHAPLGYCAVKVGHLRWSNVADGGRSSHSRSESRWLDVRAANRDQVLAAVDPA